MYCENCHRDIPHGEAYFKLNSTENVFCCKECVTDYMVYRNMLSIETNTGTGEEQEESE